MVINVTGGTISEKEKQNYVQYLYDKHPDKKITELDITVDGDFVDLSFKYELVPFERIRRITGYLVGTLDRFNNAKRAEVEDRVKHKVDNNED